MKDKMMTYAVLYGKRFNRKQKELFLNHVIEECNRLNKTYEIDSNNSKLLNVTNLYVGDLKNAKYIVAAAYDTPSKALFSSIKYYPFNPNKNSREEFKNTFIQILFLLVAVLLLYVSLKNFMTVTLGYKIFKILGIILAVTVVFITSFSKANKNNFNRNSASIALMMKLMENTKNNIGFAFLDQECNSYEGAKLLAKRFSNKKIIILDSLAYGKKMTLAHKGEVCYDSLIEDDWIDRQYNEDTINVLGLFDKGIVLTSGEIINKEFIVKNTRTNRDVEVDMNRLEHLYIRLLDYLEA